MVFLDKFAATILYGLPYFFKVPALDLNGHKAVNQCEGFVIVRAEDGGHEEPRLRRLRGLRDQMERLFKAKISFQQTREEKGRKGKAWLDMAVASEGVTWWDEKQPEQGTLWDSWIKLGEDFFNAITAAPVPVDMRVLKALKNSPLALDLYSWATYTAFRTQESGQSRFIAWKLLHEQLGGEYSSMKDFGHKARAALRKVQTVYPELGIEFEKGGVKVLPCNPSITVKAKRQDLTHE